MRLKMALADMQEKLSISPWGQAEDQPVYHGHLDQRRHPAFRQIGPCNLG